MITIQSYLLDPRLPYAQASKAKQDPDEYCIPVEDAERIRSILPKFNTRYIYGSIVLEHAGVRIFDRPLLDLIDQWWGYWLNAIEQLLADGYASYFLPDQPFEIELQVTSPTTVHLVLVYDLPVNEFVCVLLNGAEVFHRSVMAGGLLLASSQQDIERAKRLKQVVGCEYL